MTLIAFVLILIRCCKISISIEEEVTLFIELWERRIDVLLLQQVELEERVEAAGYDPRSLPCLNVAATVRAAMATASSQEETVQWDSEMSRFAEGLDKMKEENQKELVTYRDADQSFDDVDTATDEYSEEEFTALIHKAESDRFVQQFEDMPDLPPSSYPPAFGRYVPASMLKALYYNKKK